MTATEMAPRAGDLRYGMSAECLRVLHPPMEFQSGDLERLFAGSGECLQLTSGVFACRGLRVNLPAVRITELDLNCGVQIHNAVEPWRMLLLLLRPAPGSRIFCNAVECTEDNCIITSGGELAVNILGAASLLWFDIDRRALQAESTGAESLKCVLSLRPSERATLTTYATKKIADERGGPLAIEPFDEGAIDAEFGRCILELAERAGTCIESSSDANRVRLVRAAQDLMWVNIEEPPTLREICASVKCSVRTLIYSFNATFGMSPIKYFKIQRLNAARRKLLAADSNTRIFDVAADCGFWHLGHFGADYKALFGTTPKMTARPRQGPRPYDDCATRKCAGLWCV